MAYMYVPVKLCGFAIQNKKVKEFKLYLLLKYYSQNGKVILTPEVIKELSLILDCCPKTVKNNLKSLCSLKWINKNVKGDYYVVSYESLLFKHGSKEIYYKTRVEFSFSYLKDFRAYLAGAVFGYFLQLNKQKTWKEGRLRKRSFRILPHYFPLALDALVKLLRLNRSRLQKLRKSAEMKSFLVVQEKRIDQLKMNDGYHWRFNKYFPELPEGTFSKGGKVLRICPNKYKANLKYKHGRKKSIR